MSEHIERSSRYGHVAGRLSKVMNAQWRQDRRAQFVNVRNSLLAGNLGTRAAGGKPQQRWDDGVTLAKATLDQCPDRLRSSRKLSMSTRIRRASEFIRNSFLRRTEPSPAG